MPLTFDLPVTNNIIKVVGVGGGGGNAVNYMHKQGIAGVDFVVCNTDAQVLQLSAIEKKIQLGLQLTEGRGAGMNPEIGKRAAIESYEQLKDLFVGTKMIFITAGMGKGTGTGAAPVIAKIAKELGILTVGLVTTPLSVEGPRRYNQAVEGINELKNYVDTLLVVSNDKLREIYGNMKLMEAFSQANNIISNAAKAIAEIITVPGFVNVDFEDVNTVMKNSGVALMGTAMFEGENRAMNAVEAALNSPLLNDNDIRGAKNILINISSGMDEVTLDEVTDITEYVQREAGNDTNIIWGNCYNDSLENKLSVTIIATGFESNGLMRPETKNKREVVDLHGKDSKEIIKPRKTKQEIPVTTNLFEDEVKLTIESITPDITLKTETDSIIEKPKEKEVLVMKDETPVETSNDFTLKTVQQEVSDTTSEEQKLELTMSAKNERLSRLKGLSMKIGNPQMVNEMEREPAYMRRNISLDDVAHSSESTASPYFLAPNENGEIEMKKDNSFLHGNDKVD